MPFNTSTSKQFKTTLPESNLYFLQNTPDALTKPAAPSLKETQSANFIWNGVGLINSGKLPVFTAPFEIDIHNVALKTKKISCILDSRHVITATEELPSQLKGTVLQLAAKERLQANGHWIEGQEMEMHLQPLNEMGQNRLYNITLIPSQEIQGILELQGLNNISFNGIFTLIHCVSSLISTLLSEPVIVLYCERNYLKLMAIGNKMVYFLQIIPYESEDTLPMFMLNQAIDIAKKNVKKLYGLDIQHVMPIGPRYDICISENINDMPLLKPEWEKILTAPSYEDVTRFPGLYGTYFIDNSLNLMPKSWRYGLIIQKLSKITTMLSGILAIGIGGYGAYLYHLNHNQQMEYQRLYHAISTRQAAIAANLPINITKAELENWLSLKKAATERPRLDDILARIAEALEPDVSVVTLHISAMPQGQIATTPAANKPSGPAEQQFKNTQNLPTGPFQISIQMESKGTFEDTRVRINNSLTTLCKNFQLSEPDWQYDETRQVCILTCNMTTKSVQSTAKAQ